MTPRRLVLFTKPAVPGRVKTRLVPALSAAQAAELHAAFLADVAERLLVAEARGDLELWSAWALAPGEALPEGPGRPFRQDGRELGERLAHGLELAARAAGGAAAVAALGSDHPTVSVESVREAFARIEAGADLVLGPSRDGGYYLIAVATRRLRRAIFEAIPWSTGDVLARTEARAAELGLAVERVDEGYDVDTPADLDHLAAELSAGTGRGADLAGLCPRTRDLLAGWGRLTGAGPAVLEVMR